MFHGIHHAFPMDKDRLVFPIAMGIPIYFIVYFIFSCIYPKWGMDSIIAGTTFAYILYDTSHYYKG